MDWRQELCSLRTQFASASSTWPTLRHSLIAATADTHEKVLRWCDKHVTGFVHGNLTGVPRLSSIGMILSFDHLSVSGEAGKCDAAAGQRFCELGDAAGRLMLDIPESVMSTLAAPQMHADAGVYDGLWLVSDQAAKRKLAATSIAEQVRLQMFDMRGSNFEWMLLLHNLAWKATRSQALQARRFTWNDRTTIGFSSVEDLQIASRIGGMDSSPLLSLPLRWMQSDLSADPFLCSVWAIDTLLAACSEKDEVSLHAPTVMHERPGPGDQPDEQGYVSDPSDKAAYVGASEILNDHLPEAWGSVTYAQFKTMLDSLPRIRKWKPSKQRLSVHLIDWHRLTKLHQSQPPCRYDESRRDIPEVIEKRIEQARAKKSQKVGGLTSDLLLSVSKKQRSR